MNSFSIAVKLFKTNIRTYAYYLAVLIFSVAVYYEFMALKYNPEVLKAKEAVGMAAAAAQITSFVLLIFLVFFIWYSSSFFLKQRKKEIGIYSLMGISNVKTGLVFAIESLFLGITAVGAGLLTGILMSKLFFMALARMALLNVTIDFFIPVNGIYELLITFGIIFLALSARNFISVVRSRLIDLINDSKKEEGTPRLKAVRGILSILFIGLGYYISRNNFSAITMLVIVVLVVVGTYWFFGSFMSTVMIFLLGRKEILYKGTRIISISNIAYRLKSNYRSLAVLAVIAATTITAFGTSLSLKYYIDNTADIQFPYSFSYVSSDPALDKKVEETIAASGHSQLLKEQIRYLSIQNAQIEGSGMEALRLLVVGWGDFKRISGELQPEDTDKTLVEASPGDTEAYYIFAPITIATTIDYSKRLLDYNTGSLTISDCLKTPLFGDGANGLTPCIIVSDAKYSEMKASFVEKTFIGLKVSNAEASEELAAKLSKTVPKKAGLYTYVSRYRSTYSFVGLFFFLGMFMSIVFIFATGSIMYFKLLSEGLADRHKYEVLSKIGMSRDEIRSAISSQVGMSLIMPLLLGIVHSLFAINALEGILNYDLTVPMLAAISVFAVFYGAFYIMTTKKFMDMVTTGIS